MCSRDMRLIYQRRWAAVLGNLVLAVTSSLAHAQGCPPQAGESRAVTQVAEPASLALDDGSELKLASVLLPSKRDVAGDAETWPAQVEAMSALRGLVEGRTITIAADGQFRDRYDRRVGHAFATTGAAQPMWIQAALVDGGQARVAPLPGETQCASDLYAREAVARAKRVGLWSNPAYDIRDARNTRALRSLLGTFQIVEGWVVGVGGGRGREMFLNFGPDWRWDFTAGIDLRGGSEREAVAQRLRQLNGRLVRVRGFLERRNGPFMALNSIHSIEELPEGSTGSY